MATQKKVIGNMLAQSMGKVLGVVASLIVVKIVTSFGREFYGDYITAYEFLAFFGIIADAGLFTIAVREMSRNSNQLSVNSKQKNTEFILSNIFSMRLLLIVGVTLLAGITAQFIPNYSPFVKLGIWITGISMALTIVAGTLSSVLQARMKIQYFSGSLVLGKIVLAGLIFFISHNAGIFPHIFFTMLWAGVLSNIIFCGCVVYFVSKEVKIRLGFNFDWWRKTIKHSLPYGIALILQTLYLRIDIVLISVLLGASAVGVYGVSTRILESFLVLGVFFGQAILPKLSGEEHDKKKFEKTLVWGMEILLLFSLPIIIGTFKFAPEIISFLSSEEFLSTSGFFGSDKVLLILVMTVLFAYFNQLFSFSLVARNKQKYLLYINAVALSLNVVLNILFLKEYGIIAAAISTIFCEILVFSLLLYNVLKFTKLPFSVKTLSVVFFANMVLIVEIYLTPLGENLTLGAVVGSLSYIGILILFKKELLPSKDKS